LRTLHGLISYIEKSDVYCLNCRKEIAMIDRHSILIERLRRENDQFLFWEGEHKRLEREIRDLNRKNVLTPEEEIMRKNLQKEKLNAKDKMVEILKSEEDREKVKKVN